MEFYSQKNCCEFLLSAILHFSMLFLCWVKTRFCLLGAIAYTRNISSFFTAIILELCLPADAKERGQ